MCEALASNASTTPKKKKKKETEYGHPLSISIGGDWFQESLWISNSIHRLVQYFHITYTLYTIPRLLKISKVV
jgi:hypothetical protein